MPAPLLPLGHKLESAPTLTAPQTLNLARDLGVELALDGGELRAVGGRNAITELAHHIRACKPELVRLLATEAANDHNVSGTGTPATPQHTPHQYGITFSAQLKGPVPAPGQHPANTGPAPEHPAAVAWQALDKAYQAHHVKCPICIAAGRGIRYGLRCGTGASLWTAYSEAGQQPGALPWHQPNKPR